MGVWLPSVFWTRLGCLLGTVLVVGLGALEGDGDALVDVQLGDGLPADSGPHGLAAWFAAVVAYADGVRAGLVGAGVLGCLGG